MDYTCPVYILMYAQRRFDLKIQPISDNHDNKKAGLCNAKVQSSIILQPLIVL